MWCRTEIIEDNLKFHNSIRLKEIVYKLFPYFAVYLYGNANPVIVPVNLAGKKCNVEMREIRVLDKVTNKVCWSLSCNFLLLSFYFVCLFKEWVSFYLGLWGMSRSARQTNRMNREAVLGSVIGRLWHIGLGFSQVFSSIIKLRRKDSRQNCVKFIIHNYIQNLLQIGIIFLSLHTLKILTFSPLS